MGGFEETLAQLGGFWRYNRPSRYLALLTSGKVSDVFVNTGVLTCRPDHMDTFVSDLLSTNYHLLPYQVTVLGPAVGAITLAYELAVQIGNKTMALIAEKKDGGFSIRGEAPPDSTFLLCDDVITTGGSTLAVYEQARKQLPVFPGIFCLVNRSGKTTLTVDGKEWPIYSCLELTGINTWDTLEQAQQFYPDVVKALRPKQNWNQLVTG